ncbi:hypothetical protein [Alienimonas chondri]|uniref:Uncharacterized protein n=1 Tax=Alienimonas chondri TaxID=2681879 RepID=A0ABX1VD42_9PLAN|nr:hypothetical protein [Alienimonas chondri]NNJ25223.1 hypothetical protein [Alienimonas chondri]
MTTRQPEAGARLAKRAGDDSYGESHGSVMDLSGFDLSPAEASPTDAGDMEAIEDDDLPDSLVATNADFLTALDLPEVRAEPRRKRSRPRPAPAPAKKAEDAKSAGAAAGLLDAIRQREEDELEGEFEDDQFDVGQPLAAGPVPPRRRRKTQSAAATPEPSSKVNPNVLVLATVLTVPALLFGLNAAFGKHQSTRAEWREAFDQLDDLTNEFVDVAHAPEPQWVAWRAKFDATRPELRYLVEAAPDASAGGEIDRALNTLEQAVELRSDGAPPELMNKTAERAVAHAKNAAGRLGLTKLEWAR